nr:bis(5'-nucleosyl)-tetraphosphatase (symmetrical) YqeK [Sedimentibacter sp.]
MNLDEMKDILEKSIGQKRYIHSLGTMEEAVRLSVLYGGDKEKARIAGLLHDCGKSMEKNDNLTHAAKSAELARTVYHVDDDEIINAILYHTTGRENMTILEKIIYLADKTEHCRKYDGVEELRKLADSNLNDALIYSLERTIEYVEQKNQDLDIESIKTLKFLKEEK